MIKFMFVWVLVAFDGYSHMPVSYSPAVVDQAACEDVKRQIVDPSHSKCVRFKVPIEVK